MPIRSVDSRRRGGRMNNIAERLSDLDVRHGELLDKLTLLDQQIDDVLKEWTAVKEVRPELNETGTAA